MNREELCKAIYEKAYITGEFLLRSGKISNEYFDKYQFESDPIVLKEIAKAMAKLIPEGTEVLAGLEMGGIPIATAISFETGLPVTFVRKKAKEYGTCKIAEGFDIKGKNVLIIEDVITSGGQVILSTRELRDRGAFVSNALCVIDRESGGAESLLKNQINLFPLYKMEELKNSK